MTDGRSSVLTLTLLVMIDGEHFSLSLTNHSDWMVLARAESEVSVNREIFESDSSTGEVFNSDLVVLGVTIETSSPMESSPSRLRLKSWLKTILAEEETPRDSSPS